MPAFAPAAPEQQDEEEQPTHDDDLNQDDDFDNCENENFDENFDMDMQVAAGMLVPEIGDAHIEPEASEPEPGQPEPEVHGHDPQPDVPAHDEAPALPAVAAAPREERPDAYQRLYKSPADILSPLSPPGCTLSISYRDYRFRATWKKHITCEYWIADLKAGSFSLTFTKENWRTILSLVHAQAWEKWSIAHNHVQELQLPRGTSAPIPGQIDQQSINALEPIVQNMEPPTKYPRR